MSCEGLKGGRLAALIGLFSLGLSGAFGQLMPPDDFFEWSGSGGDGLWTTGTNWIGGPGGTGGLPTINADVLFANAQTVGDTYAGQGYGYKSPVTVNTNAANRHVNSLWFDTGREYTLFSNALAIDEPLTIILGEALAADGALIIAGLNTNPGAWQSEHNVNPRVTVSLPNAGWTATMASHSAGGMRIGGIHFSSGNLQQRGGGAHDFERQ